MTEYCSRCGKPLDDDGREVDEQSVCAQCADDLKCDDYIIISHEMALDAGFPEMESQEWRW